MVPYIQCDCVDSTNAEARRLLASGDIGPSAVVTAREQTAGRGTGGRTWLSPRDAGVYLTYVWRGGANGAAADDGATGVERSADVPFGRPAVSATGEDATIGANGERGGDLPLTTLYTYAAGVACVEAVRSVTGVELRIKPVNDLVWQGRKVGGILTEAVIEDGRMTALIIGVGINVWRAERPLPKEAITAASLAEITDEGEMSTEAIQRISIELVNRLNIWIARLVQRDLSTVQDCWQQHIVF